jgi:lipopolysaccharide transport system permease protein
MGISPLLARRDKERSPQAGPLVDAGETATRRQARLPRISIWRRFVDARYLIPIWAHRDFAVRYRQSGLGFLWAVLFPLTLLAVYGFVFTKVLHVSVEGGSYVVFAACGLVPWTFITSSLTLGVPSFITHQVLVGRVYFPREVVPIAATLTAAIDLVIGFGLIAGFALMTGTGLTWSALSVVPVYLGLILVVGAITVFGATLAAFARDVRFAIPLIVQVGFIMTPVMYPRDLVPDSARTLYDLNPFTISIEATRTAIMDGRWPAMLPILAVIVAGLVACLLAIRYLAAVEHRFADVL